MSDIDTLNIDNLTVKYGRRVALSRCSMTTSSGEITCVLGPNGAGKSTLIKAISGALMPTEGTVTVQGMDITGDPDRAVGQMSVVTQETTSLTGLTPVETLSFVGHIRGLKADTRETDVEHYLDVMQLAQERHTLARDLSGGMKRKLSVACALIGAPPLILLDESFAGLDPLAVRLVEQELRAVAEQGASIILVTHRMDLVERLADQVHVLFDGVFAHSWTGSSFSSYIRESGGDASEAYLRWLSSEDAEVDALLQRGIDATSQ